MNIRQSKRHRITESQVNTLDQEIGKTLTSISLPPLKRGVPSNKVFAASFSKLLSEMNSSEIVETKVKAAMNSGLAREQAKAMTYNPY